ncbi:hypothetical protein [Streptomyces sviceus]|uniref:hypothetical protein n=1 Tax=Streptomyces sviceus TaxID=285530 RepID=UPI003325CC9A
MSHGYATARPLKQQSRTRSIETAPGIPPARTTSPESARTRRSVGARPAGPFGEVPAGAPGELTQIDSTPVDVLVRLDDGVAEKVAPTGMVDGDTPLTSSLATRSVPS